MTREIRLSLINEGNFRKDLCGGCKNQKPEFDYAILEGDELVSDDQLCAGCAAMSVLQESELERLVSITGRTGSVPMLSCVVRER